MSAGQEATSTQGSVEQSASAAPDPGASVASSDLAPAVQADRPTVDSPAAPPVAVAYPAKRVGLSGAWWTIPMLCAGICLIACAMIVSQVEENRQLAWQRNKLKQDLEHLKTQYQTNKDFLDRIPSDATVAERLAQRQMKMVREGAAVLEVKGLEGNAEGSAFRLVTIPPPPAIQPYAPGTSLLSRLFNNPQIRLWAYALGAMMIATSLILGGATERED